MASYLCKEPLQVGNTQYTVFSFRALADRFKLERLPYCLKILLENLLRHADQEFVSVADIEALAGWDPEAEPDQEIAFVPARVLLQDFTGVPAIVDLAAMRDAMQALGGSPERINPLSPVELVIDHSVMVDFFGSADSFRKNTEVEIERNRERYQFLRWGQQAFENFKVVPPGTGIVHQVNLEYLARGVMTRDEGNEVVAYPDTLVGTDSHTTMINSLGVLGWGVGGIEAEAAMLGQPISMLIPQVVGFRLSGQLPEGATATDLVLTVTEMLRRHGVVGKFVEFFGPGLKYLSLADRATIANMAPEYGATCGIFPPDRETLDYLRLTGRDGAQLALVESYMKHMGMWHDDSSPKAAYSSRLELDLGQVEPSLAGPRRPQDRVPLGNAKQAFELELETHLARHGHRGEAELEGRFEDEGGGSAPGNSEVRQQGAVEVDHQGQHFLLQHGDVVIAAITSCTNTSNPTVLIGAGLLAQKAHARGLTTPPWVKTSLAPGSQVVTEYLQKAGLLEPLQALGFYLVGYGCTTCIGNSGPLPEPISDAIREAELMAVSVLSGNRNFEGRIHPDVRANYLASPPLVVAYALAGTMKRDLLNEPLGTDPDGRPVYLQEIWPSDAEIRQTIDSCVEPAMFRRKYADIYAGNAAWNSLPVAGSQLYGWPESSYVRQPPFFIGINSQPPTLQAIEEARCLVKVGDSITTDHISPAGAIQPDSPAGRYLQQLGITPKEFNSYGSRRGNHEVMMRGTFANVRLQNQLAPGTEGSWTCYFPENQWLTIFDAAEKYRAARTPLLVLAGSEYGTGSSRDWAAKGPALLGVKVVIAQSYERIHRSNLVGMGILPLQFMENESADTLGLDGSEIFAFPAIQAGQKTLEVSATRGGGRAQRFKTRISIDTPNEFDYYRHGGILHYVLRKLAGKG